MFMLSILHMLYMDPHVSKYITYYFGNTVNLILKLLSKIVFQFHSNYLFISQYCKQDMLTWTVTWKVYDIANKICTHERSLGKSTINNNNIDRNITKSSHMNDHLEDLWFFNSTYLLIEINTILYIHVRYYQ